jgi:hypothetical protein
MKKFTTFFLALTAIALLSLSSCKKIWDEIKQHPNGTADNCKIDKIYFKWMHFLIPDEPSTYTYITDTARFTYNVKGNPTSMTFASTPVFHYDAYPSDCFFRYDNQNRLVVFLEHGSVNQYSEYDNQFWDGALFWHKYTYVNTHLVIDSMFIYASGNSQSNTPIYPSEGQEIRFELDDYGRIIKEIRYDETIVYTYDQSGNLVKPGVTYTSKKNIKQTNKVWMFIARDYSVNTPVGDASQYNSNNLPVVFNKLIPGILDPTVFYLQPNEKVRVSYQCK